MDLHRELFLVPRVPGQNGCNYDPSQLWLPLGHLHCYSALCGKLLSSLLWHKLQFANLCQHACLSVWHLLRQICLQFGDHRTGKLEGHLSNFAYVRCLVPCYDVYHLPATYACCSGPGKLAKQLDLKWHARRTSNCEETWWNHKLGRRIRHIRSIHALQQNSRQDDKHILFSQCYRQRKAIYWSRSLEVPCVLKSQLY